MALKNLVELASSIFVHRRWAGERIDTRFFSSKGIPGTFVVNESFVVEGEIENLIMSPKLTT